MNNIRLSWYYNYVALHNDNFIFQAVERKRRLDDSYHLHRFLSDFRDLLSWIQDMKAIISADDLAKDVAGAEALLERHQEHKVEKTRSCYRIG